MIVKGKRIMNDSSLNATEIAVGSLLAGNRGGGGYGGGGGGAWSGFNANMMGAGNSTLAAEAHANGTAIKEAIDCNAIRVSDGINRVSDQAEEGRRSAQVTSLTDGMINSEFRSSDRLAATNKNISDSEFRSLDRQRDIERLINQNAIEAAKCCCETQKAIADAAKEAAKCCCDAQLEAAKSHATIMASVVAENAATRELMRGDALAAANAKIVQLETINALSNRHHG